MAFTPWVKHILGEADEHGQHCILCGVEVAPHALGPLPDGVVYEHDGRLALIEPLGNIITCTERTTS